MRRMSLLHYGEAILAVAMATIIRQLLDPWLGRTQAFSWYCMAVAIAAWFGGWRCSLLASALGYAAADWFFVEPRHVLNTLFAGRAGLGLASYASVCTAIAACMEAVRRQAPTLILRLDLDDSLALLDLATSVRMHGIGSYELPDYLDGLNASPSVCRLAMHFARQDMTPRELAARLEGFVKGSGSAALSS